MSWARAHLQRYGQAPQPATVLHGPEKLLGWATLAMVMQYHQKMKEHIPATELPPGVWSFASQVPSLNRLVQYVNAERGVTVPLLLVSDGPYLDLDDPVVKQCTSREFLFTFVVREAEGEVLHKLVSRIPRAVFGGTDALVDKSTRWMYADGHKFSSDKEKLMGFRDLLPQRDVYASMSGLCSVCDRAERTLQCSRCKAVYYCGREHQKADWKRHKTSCDLMSAVANDKPARHVAAEPDLSEEQKLQEYADRGQVVLKF